MGATSGGLRMGRKCLENGLDGRRGEPSVHVTCTNQECGQDAAAGAEYGAKAAYRGDRFKGPRRKVRRFIGGIKLAVGVKELVGRRLHSAAAIATREGRLAG